MDLLKAGKELLSDEEVEVFYSYAFSYYNSGHWNEAIEIFQLLCMRRPLEFRFWFGLGAVLQEQGAYVDALHAWAMAALLNQTNPYPHFHAAECYFSLSNDLDATKALTQAAQRIATEENHPLAHKIALLKEQWRITA